MRAPMSSTALFRTLKQSFGYDSFRPLQEEIITDALAGRDVFALLPTGGGKSLCFQLPALIRDGLTVVVSPLIALMKDQVDALTASGVAATFINSTLGAAESKARLRGLFNGEYRMLYAAPERLMLDGTIEMLRQWNVAQFAIDEAHCISEWGHDFRPEYRQLAKLRDVFPGVPFMALTATATERVRGDIVKHLRLREPRTYVASFNRPNLAYRVLPKARPYEQTLAFIRGRKRECGIVYCSSRKATESVAEKLVADGIAARPYHAGLDDKTRAQNQELFLRDEIHVICATIAFGMGINKPNVRFVLHYDLPKNVEGYYQETGRAGRDGLPSECLLLYSSGDVVKQTSFIEEKSDPEEQRVAREQLQKMVHYAECAACRRAELLRYFGEEFGEPNCGGCDNCLEPRETFDGTLATQKFLSCVYRLRQASRFGVGLNHIVEVLTGGGSEKVLKWGHDKVSTYGIGKEHTRTEWAALGREIIRLGYCRQSTEKFSTIELTDAGMEILRSRKAVTLTRPPAEPERGREDKRRVGDIACDEALFEQLRHLRKEIADSRDVPAYIIFSDVSLRIMAREYPTTERAFANITGVGTKKLDEFGAQFMDAILKHLRENPRQVFADELDRFNGPPPKKVAATTSRESWRMFAAGQSFAQIARARSLTEQTVVKHIADAIEAGESFDADAHFTAAEQQELNAAFDQLSDYALGPVKDFLGDRYDYSRLHLFRAARRARQRGAAP
jgi:ATP-dependent DNA helicase RecQ